MTMPLLRILLPLLLCPLLGCVGVQANGQPPQDDDSAPGDDDDMGDDDSAAGDDDSAGDDDVVDDNTCDEDASSDQVVRFAIVRDQGGTVEGAQWQVFDMDPNTGEVMTDVVAEGETGADGYILATLDCAAGWMMVDVRHPDFVVLRVFFRVLDTPGRQTAMLSLESADEIVGANIASPDLGFLTVIKRTVEIASDLQGEDTCTIDDSSQLIPWDAEDDNGLWVFDGAFSQSLFGMWYADYELAGDGTVVYLRYEDLSSDHTTLINLPVWSYSDDGEFNMTVVTIES